MKLYKELITIVGIRYRFPDANSLGAFWQLLYNVTEVPASQWDIEAFYDPSSTKPSKMNTCWGGFLEQVDQFDPQFFVMLPVSL
ncbi:hypothetical protein DSM106972_044340 [Dulcicalothrix desertica PCC 7102]|uniref:Beta-ketoacyl synthase-like N-terminal domain-containing protein n=1 Tax=Dulcicalothrix desertica PCC 7102 TaxID=232991 RepID=A0A433VDL9_9CYAN|nr:beta-ketoacyl synthase N-terminal-like domain-containing protein [Dulcicalothrix desertica]RUT04206.1 hypothetical protein DSM106972_044340 [Dulcicalothrix desertica PCC 7102]TWH44214.1 beta-ketoacyl synthase-like protein [Dulcicalothrix desertica PCC 7102]TWH51488.1 beta-ketoacyl synthase-like protein [Dulcicalothrix desertica PCC 7102]